MILETAIRALRGSPGFSAVVVVTMAVAIAANTAIFSVYDRLVLHPVNIPDAGSLVAIWFDNPQRNIQTPSILLTAASIVTVEVRHSGAVGELLGRNISPSGAFDAGKTMDQVLAIVNKTKFIRS